MNERQIMVQRDLRDVTVEQLANSLAATSQIEVHARGIRPGASSRLDLQAGRNKPLDVFPFPLVLRAGQKLAAHWIDDEEDVVTDLAKEAICGNPRPATEHVIKTPRIDQAHLLAD